MKECVLSRGKVELSTHSSPAPVSYLCICDAAHCRGLHVSSQRASVKCDKSPSSRLEPVCTSDCCGFMFAGAKEDGRNSGSCAAEAREQSGRPANDCGPADEGRMKSHAD